MTTITFEKDLGLKKTSFTDPADLYAYLTENDLWVELRELSDEECTPDMRKKGQEAVEEYRKNPSSFTSICEL